MIAMKTVEIVFWFYFNLFAMALLKVYEVYIYSKKIYIHFHVIPILQWFDHSVVVSLTSQFVKNFILKVCKVHPWKLGRMRIDSDLVKTIIIMIYDFLISSLELPLILIQNRTVHFLIYTCFRNYSYLEKIWSRVDWHCIRALSHRKVIRHFWIIWIWHEKYKYRD